MPLNAIYALREQFWAVVVFYEMNLVLQALTSKAGGMFLVAAVPARVLEGG